MICVAPASSAFSTSSFTTAAGRSITSPAAMRLTREGGSCWIGLSLHAVHCTQRVRHGGEVRASAIMACDEARKDHEVLEGIAPLKYAERWDNVGLLAGDARQEVTGRSSRSTIRRRWRRGRMKRKSELVIAYHPPIFETIKRLTAPSLVYEAIRRGMAIYSPHTALDVAEGGTNDVLAEIWGFGTPCRCGRSPSPRGITS